QLCRDFPLAAEFGGRRRAGGGESANVPCATRTAIPSRQKTRGADPPIRPVVAIKKAKPSCGRRTVSDGASGIQKLVNQTRNTNSTPKTRNSNKPVLQEMLNADFRQASIS